MRISLIFMSKKLSTIWNYGLKYLHRLRECYKVDGSDFWYNLLEIKKQEENKSLN